MSPRYCCVCLLLPQLSVDDGQKTKENYRLTIRKLREENTALKAKTAEATKEKPTPPPVVKPEKPQLVSKEQQAMDEMIEMRVERTQLQEQLKSAQRDIDSLRAQIKGHSLEKQATNAIKRNVRITCIHCRMRTPLKNYTFCAPSNYMYHSCK